MVVFTGPDQHRPRRDNPVDSMPLGFTFWVECWGAGCFDDQPARSWPHACPSCGSERLVVKRRAA